MKNLYIPDDRQPFLNDSDIRSDASLAVFML